MKLVHSWLITLSFVVELYKCLAETMIMTRQCVACKNHIASSKVKVTVCMLTLCIGQSVTCLCLAHHFVLHSGISKLFGVNNYHDKMQ